jgi:hypothetical protein
MAIKANTNSKDFSLIQNQDAQRMLLNKMRSKLAAGSIFEIQANEKRKLATQKSIFRWSSLIGLLAIVFLGNLAYLAYKHDSKSRVIIHKAQVLAVPNATLSNELQALYWTYALYDFDLLKTRFNVPASVIINATVAESKLKVLLPKLDAQTRFIINGYISKAMRNK